MVARAGQTRRALAALGLVAAVLTAGAGPLHAHGINTSQLRLRLEGAQVHGEWETALADARKALGLDPQAAGEAAWREVRDREPALRALIARQLKLASDGASCPLALNQPVSWQAPPGQLVVRFAASCPSSPTHLRLACDLLFDVDAGHRVYFSIADARVTHVGLLASSQRTTTIEVHAFEFWSGFAEFAAEGVGHIWGGLDHLLFLVALLLPAPLLLAGDGWVPRPGLGAAIREVIKIVSAFTLAHSLTLGLSFFGLVTLPARWVEVAIAASVFAAAWNNLRRFLPGHTWLMAFGFGLVHGFGFAGALRNLALPTHARGVALAAFNVGVELGQVAIVAVVLPLLYLASRRRWYPRPVMGAGSLMIAWLAVVWMLERGLGIPVLGRF